MSIRSLLDVPGVGEKTRKKLVERFGSEEEALRALLECRVSEVAEAVGSYRKAVALVLAAQKAVRGAGPDDFLKTRDARKIYEAVLAKLQSYACTSEAKEKLITYYPLPSKLSNEVEKRLRRTRKAIELYASLGKEKVERIRENLRRMARLQRVQVVRIDDRAVVLSDDDYAKLSNTLKKYVKVYAASGADVAELAAEHRLVVLAGGTEPPPLPNVVYVGSADPEELVPEAVLAFFIANRSVVEAAAEIARILGDAYPELSSLRESLEEARRALGELEGYEPARGMDEEYDRLKDTLRRLDHVVSEIEEWANDEVKRRLESLEVKLSAAKLLEILNALRTGSIEEHALIPDEVYEAIDDVLREARRKLISSLKLSEDEAILAQEVIPLKPALPVQINEEVLRDLKSLLSAKLEARRFEALRRVAKKLKGLEEAVTKAYKALIELDELLAIACMAADYELSVPEVTASQVGVAFQGGLELGLRERELRGEGRAQRVDYVVGNIDAPIGRTRGERVVLLTGANSGGKTTLLKLIAEVVIMAQSGLPVPARRAWVGLVDELYFLSKPEGMISAGALETMLQLLARIACSSGKKLVLADELEAATEAHAAAVVTAVFAKRLAENPGAVAVIVSHLAEEALNIIGCDSRVRVDGIEARGLDESYNLIVDRQPVFYKLARSTPELVVTKLYHKHSGEARVFYEELLKTLRRGRS